MLSLGTKAHIKTFRHGFPGTRVLHGTTNKSLNYFRKFFNCNKTIKVTKISIFFAFGGKLIYIVVVWRHWVGFMAANIYWVPTILDKVDLKIICSLVIDSLVHRPTRHYLWHSSRQYGSNHILYNGNKTATFKRRGLKPWSIEVVLCIWPREACLKHEKRFTHLFSFFARRDSLQPPREQSDSWTCFRNVHFIQSWVTAKGFVSRRWCPLPTGSIEEGLGVVTQYLPALWLTAFWPGHGRLLRSLVMPDRWGSLSDFM